MLPKMWWAVQTYTRRSFSAQEIFSNYSMVIAFIPSLLLSSSETHVATSPDLIFFYPSSTVFSDRRAYIVACLGCLIYPGTTRSLWSTNGPTSPLCLMPFSGSPLPTRGAQLPSMAHWSSVICSGFSLSSLPSTSHLHDLPQKPLRGLASCQVGLAYMVPSAWNSPSSSPCPLPPGLWTSLHPHTSSTAWLRQLTLITES